MKDVRDYKITIIPLDDNCDYICRGRLDEENRHGDLLKSYGTMTYGDNSIFNIMDDGCSPTLFEHYLELYGNLVFYL